MVERIIYRDGDRHRVQTGYLDMDAELTNSRTKQEFKMECDINEVIRRWTKTGILPPPRAPEKYGDFTEVNDYQSAINHVKEADQAFSELPAHMRSRFNNSPAELLEFLQDDANGPEAVELGIIPAPGQPAPPAPTPPQPEGEPPLPTTPPVAGGE